MGNDALEKLIVGLRQLEEIMHFISAQESHIQIVYSFWNGD
jgi:hypothetical protein